MMRVLIYFLELYYLFHVVLARAPPCICWKNNVFCSQPAKLSQIFRSCRSYVLPHEIHFIDEGRLQSCELNAPSIVLNPRFVVSLISFDKATTNKRQMCRCFSRSVTNCQFMYGCSEYCNDLTLTSSVTGILSATTLVYYSSTRGEFYPSTTTSTYDVQFENASSAPIIKIVNIVKQHKIPSVMYIAIGTTAGLAAISMLCLTIICCVYKKLCCTRIGGRQVELAHLEVLYPLPDDKVDEIITLKQVGGTVPRVDARTAAGSAALMRNECQTVQTIPQSRSRAQVVKFTSQSPDANEIHAMKAAQSIDEKVISVKTICRGIYEVEFQSSTAVEHCLLEKQICCGTTCFSVEQFVEHSHSVVDVTSTQGSSTNSLDVVLESLVDDDKQTHLLALKCKDVDAQFRDDSTGATFSKVIELDIISLSNEAELAQLFSQFGAVRIESTVPTNIIIIYFVVSHSVVNESSIHLMCGPYGVINRIMIDRERNMKCAVVQYLEQKSAASAKDRLCGFTSERGRPRGCMIVYAANDCFDTLERRKKTIMLNNKISKHLTEFAKCSRFGRQSYSNVQEKKSPVSPTIDKIVKSNPRKLFTQAKPSNMSNSSDVENQFPD